jgi:toxin-antitoxin system PIN domain toxin
MRYLLDVNVLIALIDPAHIYHNEAHVWFSTKGKPAWATCPLTENGVLRIVGNARYPNSPGSPVVVLESLNSLCGLSGHEFWPDDVSLLDTKKINAKRLLSSEQLTDTYLLALAIFHGGQLATFDRRLVVDAVGGGKQAIHYLL